MAFEIAVADALADQLRKQSVQRLQLSFGRIARRYIGREALNDVGPRQELGDQKRFTAQPHEAFFQQRQRCGRCDAEEPQPIAFAPRVPGTGRTPKALEPVSQVLDVVALDHQFAAGDVYLGDAGRTTGLVQMTALDQHVGLFQHRQHRRHFLATNRAQGERPVFDAEQAAFTADLDQVIPQAPTAHLVDLLLQRFDRQAVLAVAQQVIDE